MHKRRIFFLTAYILAAIFTAGVFHSAHAVLTKQLSYQGRLQDASGAPVANGAYSVTFSIYNAPTGGSALYTETQNVTVDKGGFSAYIGSVTPLNLPFNEDYFLGLTVGSDPEMTPRLKLSVVGTAVFAMDAANLGGQPSGNFALTSHTHTLSVGSTEIIDGSVNAGDIDATTVQRRVTGTCAGQVLVAINQDGTVTCEADDTGGGGGGTPAISVTSVGASAVVGTSTNYAREDHVHNIPAGFITDAMVNASAAIAKSKLGPLNIVNADVDPSAAIAKSKLNLSNSILFSDIAQNGCASGQVVEWNGTAWSCGTDDTGAGGIVTNPTAAQTLQGTAGSFTPLIIKGQTGQSAPIFEVQNDAGTRLAAVMSDGHLIVDTVLHLVNVDNNSPTGPMGNMTVDVMNATGDSKLIVTNSDATYKASLDVEGQVLVGNPVSTNAKVSAEETGTVNAAGTFKIVNAGNANDAIFGRTTGTGKAGNFQIINGGSAAAAVSASTNGTGSLFMGNATSTGNLLQLQVSAVDKFVVNNAGRINTPSVDTGSIVDSTILFADIGSNSCAGGQVMEYNGTAWVCGSGVATQWTTSGADIYFSTGNVGIGTTAPGAKLDVAGSVRFGNNVWHTSADAKNRLYFGGNNTTYFGSANGYEWRNAADVTIMQLLSDGNVGIGTTGPTAKLHVDTSAAQTVMFGNTTSTGNLLQLQVSAADKFVVSNAGLITSASVDGASLVDGSVGATDIANAAITNAHIFAAANIAQTKIAGGPFISQSPGAGQMLQPTADVVPLFIRDDAGAVAALFDIQDNAGTTLVKVTGAGNLLVGNPTTTTAKVSAYETGTVNSAGYFEINNASTSNHAVYAYTNGTGNAVYGEATGTGVAVGGTTTGTGVAGVFRILNVSSSNTVLHGNTTGTGNLLQLQKGGVDKFVVNNAGSVTVFGILSVTGDALFSAGILDNATKPFTVTDTAAAQIIKMGNNCEALVTSGVVTVTFAPAFAATPTVTFGQTSGTAPSPASTITAKTASSFTVSGFETSATSECIDWIAIGNK